LTPNIAPIADAVTTALNAAPPGTFSKTFTAKRIYRPEFKREELGTLHVTVIPGPVTRNQIARRLLEKTYVVGVLVQQAVTGEQNEDIDPLTGLCEEIADFIGPGEIGTTGAAWTATEHDPIYDPDHMKDFRVFTNVVSFTFKL
jgi:hypothetical protein